MLDGRHARLVDAGGTRLSVAEHGPEDGTGLPVLLLHGFGGSAAAMQPVVAALGARRRVIVPDLVGHGRSEAPRDDALYSWDAVPRQLAALLDATGVGRAHVFGFSLGGRLAFRLAARATSRIASVVAVGARCVWLDDADRARRRAADADLARRLEAQGALGLARALRALGAADQPEVDAATLVAAGVPVLLVAGAEDRGPLGAARALAARLATACVISIPGAGHRAHLERTDEVVRLALELYASVDRDETEEQRARRAAAAKGEGRW